MMSGFQMTSMILTSCHTHSVQLNAVNSNVSCGCGGGGLCANRYAVDYPRRRAMRQRILGSHTPPCHMRMVITTLFSVFLAALQRRPEEGGGGYQKKFVRKFVSGPKT